MAVSAFGGLRRLFPIVAGKVLGEMALSSETACLALYLVSIRDILEEPSLKSIQRLNDNYLDGFGSLRPPLGVGMNFVQNCSKNGLKTPSLQTCQPIGGEQHSVQN